MQNNDLQLMLERSCLTSANPSGWIIVSNQLPKYTFPLGVGYIVGYLKERGENASLVFWPDRRQLYHDFARSLVASKPLVVGFGGLYPDLYQVREIIHFLNVEGRNFPIVIGGQMVSPIPEFAVKITGADYGVVGEGEIIFHELVMALRERRDPSNVRGLVLRDGRECVKTGEGPQIKDLALLPRLPFEDLPNENWLHTGRFYVGYAQPQWRFSDRVVPVHGGRGCPYRCNFCYHHGQARYRPLDVVIGEAKELAARFNATLLDFSDDLVIATPQRAEALVAAMANFGRPIEYYMSIRFDILSKLDDHLLRELKRTGCRTVGPGLESGSQRVLDIIGKRITIEQITTGLRRLKKAGILVTTAIQVGQVDETMDEVRQSLDLMCKAIRYDPNIAFAFSITTPFPGSELYRLAFENGILKSDLDFFERFDPVNDILGLAVNLSAMSDKEVIAARQLLQKTYVLERRRLMPWKPKAVEYFYRRIGQARGIMKAGLDRWFPDWPIFRGLFRLFDDIYNGIQSRLDRLWCRMLGV